MLKKLENGYTYIMYDRRENGIYIYFIRSLLILRLDYQFNF